MLARWLFFGLFCPLITFMQYHRLQTWLEFESLKEENEFLRQRLPVDFLPQLRNATPAAEGRQSRLAQLARDLCRTVARWGPGDDTHSGFPTLVFLILMSVYLWKVYKWLNSEMALYTRLEEGVKEMAIDRSKYSVVNFLSYRADFWLSNNSYVKPIALGTFTLLTILLGGVLRCLLTGPSVGASLWNCWIFVVDTSAHAGEDSVSARLTAFVMTVGGMFIFAMMIGLISDGLAAQVEALHNGSAPVLECGHIVILGWSNKLLPMLNELTLANLSVGGCVITILAEKEKADMEVMLEASGVDLRGCKVVCRKGTPTVRHDLQHVSVKSARVIIVLSPASGERSDEADVADGYVLRVLLCLKGMDCVGHVVAELQDVDNLALTHIVGGAMLETVVAHDFIGRLIVQSGRQPGLAQVMEALLGFGGHEFYMKEWPQLAGAKFGDVLFQFPTAIPLGVITADEICLLNPSDDYRIQEGDQLIVLAEDEDTYSPEPTALRTAEDVSRSLSCNRASTDRARGPENALVLGWRRDLGDILSELNATLPPGSKVTLLCKRPVNDGSRDRELQQNGRSDPSTFRNIVLEHVQGNPVSRYDLERLVLSEYRTAFLLHEEGKAAQEADSCIVTSLFLLKDVHTRQMRAKGGDYLPLTIISEVLDPHTRHQLAMAGVHDFVMSNEVVSAALAMVAECRAVNRILRELLSADGCEMYIRPVSAYCRPGQTMSFLDMMLIVRHSDAILVGYATAGGPPELNPDNKQEPRTWSGDDKLVVLAEE